MTISEPSTVITDYALAAVAASLAVQLGRSGRTAARLWKIGFATAALAAAVGGTYHGLKLHLAAATQHGLWTVTAFLIGAGVAFLTSAAVSSRLDAGARRWLAGGLVLILVALAIAVAGLAPHRHFNQYDVAHCVLIVALGFLYRGAKLT